MDPDQPRRNRSFSFSSNSKKENKSKTFQSKGFSKEKDTAKNTPPESLVALSPILPRLGALSRQHLPGVSDPVSGNRKAESSETLSWLDTSYGSMPLILFTAPVSDTEQLLVSHSSNMAENESSDGTELPSISSPLSRQGKEIAKTRKLEEKEMSQTNEEETEVFHVTTNWLQEQFQQDNHGLREQ